MGCDQFFHDKLDELGFLLNEYEKTLDLIFREKLPDNKKTEYKLNNEERKEQIRIHISELNHFFENNPKDVRINRFRKLNEKYQYLLLEESNILNEEKEEVSNTIDNCDKKSVRFFPE